MSKNLKKERLKYQDELQELKAQNRYYHNWIKNGINFIINLPEGLQIVTLKRNKQLMIRYFLKNYNLMGKGSNRFFQ